MDLWSHPYVMTLRSALRRAGVTKLVGAPSNARNRARRIWYRVQRPATTEARVDNAAATLLVADASEFVRVQSFREDRHILREILSSLAPGETYWDVGASLGLYSLLAASRVGERGTVIAFEPEPRSRARCEQNVATNRLRNVRVLPVALGREAAHMTLQGTDNFTSGAHSLVPSNGTNGAHATTVEVARGDDLRAREKLPIPTAIKVDVEGFEEDVLEGLRQTISDPACRTLVCEVHFGILESRGHKDAPARIAALLRDCGFHRQTWLDHSHLAAHK